TTQRRFRKFPVVDDPDAQHVTARDRERLFRNKDQSARNPHAALLRIQIQHHVAPPDLWQPIVDLILRLIELVGSRWGNHGFERNLRKPLCSRSDLDLNAMDHEVAIKIAARTADGYHRVTAYGQARIEKG